MITGLAVGGSAAGAGALGRGLLLAAPVFGLCVLAGVVAGEVSVRPAAGRTRAAVLEVRRVRDYLPRGLTRAVLGATAALAALAALAAVTTATADALRRRAAWTVTGACGILVAVPLAGLCVVSAGAMLSLFCRPAWLTVAGWALVTLAVAAVGLLSWCAAVLLAPGRVVTAALPVR